MRHMCRYGASEGAPNLLSKLICHMSWREKHSMLNRRHGGQVQRCGSAGNPCCRGDAGDHARPARIIGPVLHEAGQRKQRTRAAQRPAQDPLDGAAGC